MAFGRAQGYSAPASATQMAGPFTGDRRVNIYVAGTAQVRMGFAQGDVSQAGSGFAIPVGGIEFVLADGDELWLAGDSSQWQTRVYTLITKVA